MSLAFDLSPRKKPYNVSEIAQILNISVEQVRRQFRDYPGVLKFSIPRVGKRPYCTMRIPDSVLRRWIAENTVAAPPLD